MARKNFFKSLLFVENEEQEEKKEKEKEAVEIQPPAQDFTRSAVSVSSSLNFQGTPQEEYVSGFEKVMEEANLPGPDYFELKQSMENDIMKKTFPEEKQRILSAFMGIKMSSGKEFSKSTVLNSCDAYIAIIEEQRKVGLETLAEKKKVEIDDVQSEIKLDEERILALENELSELRKKVLDKKNNVIQARNEYILKEANFNASADYMANLIKEDRDKFTNILSDEQ